EKAPTAIGAREGRCRRFTRRGRAQARRCVGRRAAAGGPGGRPAAEAEPAKRVERSESPTATTATKRSERRRRAATSGADRGGQTRAIVVESAIRAVRL